MEWRWRREWEERGRWWRRVKVAPHLADVGGDLLQRGGREGLLQHAKTERADHLAPHGGRGCRRATALRSGGGSAAEDVVGKHVEADVTHAREAQHAAMAAVTAEQGLRHA